jgi:uncharacterized protein YhhL (DUF1145 family)
MADTLSQITEVLDRFLKLLGFVGLGFIILMGLAHRAGVRVGREMAQRQRIHRGQPPLTPLFRDDAPLALWKDEALLRGGLQGIGLIACFLSWVVVMLLFFFPSPEELPGTIAYLLGFPNVMAGVMVLILAPGLGRRSKPFPWAVAALSVALAAASFHLLDSTLGPMQKLGWQTLILLAQSICTSYVMGLNAGIQEPAFENRYPLVEVVKIDGTTIQGLRLVRGVDTEYRFIDTNGVECLIPEAQVSTIRAKVPPPTGE